MFVDVVEWNVCGVVDSRATCLCWGDWQCLGLWLGESSCCWERRAGLSLNSESFLVIGLFCVVCGTLLLVVLLLVVLLHMRVLQRQIRSADFSPKSVFTRHSSFLLLGRLGS